jgi:hypothetical protein
VDLLLLSRTTSTPSFILLSFGSSSLLASEITMGSNFIISSASISGDGIAIAESTTGSKTSVENIVDNDGDGQERLAKQSRKYYDFP